MGAIDTDRSLAMAEKGWEVGVDTLVPITCSPKNQVLWGRRTIRI
jgi:hypothetical protein